MINVTKPFFPPIDEYKYYLDQIWKREWITNNGPLVNELELKLKEYLGIDHLLFLSNGTIALQIAIKALGLDGEVITTPFSYVATTSSLVWEGCTPIFVDIDSDTLNIDPNKIEAAISPNTKAILATHVYGNPCDIDAIDQIAKKHKLKVIYDAAHCFGTQYKGRSVFEYGDISTVSFHATKLFHTAEGGAVITKSPELLKSMALMRNFGHDGPEKFTGIGINAKNSEVHAALGLINLKHIGHILKRRNDLFLYYNNKLENLRVKQPKVLNQALSNNSYYPIVFESEELLLNAIDQLNKNWIYPRRYFYPCLNFLEYLDESKNPIAEEISKKILCLPMYHDLTYEEIDLIARLLLRAQNN